MSEIFDAVQGVRGFNPSNTSHSSPSHVAEQKRIGLVVKRGAGGRRLETRKDTKVRAAQRTAAKRLEEEFREWQVKVSGFKARQIRLRKEARNEQK